ncbi:MAG TPA: crossover junction endodeoxyribonuclease RuvC [Bryobacteraceae bacterium]|jgi:crossover junction endodeoxyribonuclease RuvC|nr:crossover junction endodeoxyribonuclease RuvC [Bryobacteraceae bacterium]
MRIVGIDCGTERTGFGVIDSDGRSHRFLSGGVIRTLTSHALEERLKTIATELREVLGKFSPEAIAVEEVFHAVNAKSALKLAHVRGVALLLAAEAGLAVSEYSALEVKISVVGYGRAEKQQVRMMVCSLLGITRDFESYDATDALAVAICHATRTSFPVLAGVRA